MKKKLPLMGLRAKTFPKFPLVALMLVACFTAFNGKLLAQQATFDFNSSTYNSTTLGNVQANVGTYFKSTSGGTLTTATIAACNGYTTSVTTGSSLFIFQATSSITAITVYATGTGSNRTFSSLTTSSTLGGTYTTASAAGSGTIGSGTCGSIAVTPSSTIAAGTFMKLTFSGNLNVTSVVLTLAVTAPTVTSATVSAITSSTASSGGNVTSSGNATVTARGVVWGTSAAPTVPSVNSTSDGTGTGSYTSSLTGLSPNTVYYVRAYATNSQGTSYGSDVQFTTDLVTTNYYNISGSDITNVANWGTSTNGSGAHPTNFTNSGQIFNVVNAGSTMSSAWTVSGTSSKIIIGDGTNPVSFTVPAANSVTATVDVANNGTLILQNATAPTFGSMANGSTVAFDGNGSLTIPVANYYNLSSTNDGGATRTLASGTVAVSGNFVPGSATYTTTGNTVSFNGTSAQSIPSFSFGGLSIDNGSASIGSTTTVTGALSVNQNLSIGGTLTITSAGSLTIASGKTLTLNGTLDNQSAATITLTGNMIANNGSIYKVNAAVTNSYVIPAITFNTGSTLLILQGAPRIPQTVGGNVAWNSTGTGTFLNNATNTISGDFTITAGQINNGSGGTGRSLTVGNLYIQGGEYDVSASGATTTNTLVVNGTTSVTAGTLYASTATSGPGIINAKGDVAHSAGTFGVASSITNGTIQLNAASTQNFSTMGLANGTNVTIGSASSPAVTFTSDLTVNTGSTLLITAGSLTIAPSKVLTIAGTGNFNAKSVTLASSAVGTASIGNITGTLSNASNVTTQTFIPAGRRAFRFLGHPFSESLTMASLIDDIFITGAGAGFDATATNNPSAFWFNPSATAPGAWAAFTSASDASWTQYRGMRVLVRGDRTQTSSLTGGNPTPNAVTLDVTGTLNNGPANIPLGTSNAYHFVANPYPSPVDIGTVIAATANIGTQYWVWDANAMTRGAYVTKTVGGGVYSLAMNGSFIVQPTAVTSLGFAESNKTATATSSLFRNNTAKAKQLELEVQYSNYYADNMFVRFNKDAQAAFDQNDGNKLTNQDANLYALSTDGKKLSLDTRPFDENTVIPVGFTTTVVGDYKIKVANNNLEAGMEVYLKDKLLNTLIRLDANTEYSFSVSGDAASQGENRFELVMKQAILVPIATSFSVKMSPNPASDLVKVAFTNAEIAGTSISIVDANGKSVRTVDAGKVLAGEVSIKVKGLAKGTYFVTLGNGKDRKTEKLQVQ